MTASASRSLSQKRGFCDSANPRHRANRIGRAPNPGTLHSATAAVDELEGQINWRQGRLGVASVGDTSRLREYKSDWQISGKRRLAALGHATGRVLNPA
jgi:hypothetical protein